MQSPPFVIALKFESGPAIIEELQIASPAHGNYRRILGVHVFLGDVWKSEELAPVQVEVSTPIGNAFFQVKQLRFASPIDVLKRITSDLDDLSAFQPDIDHCPWLKRYAERIRFLFQLYRFQKKRRRTVVRLPKDQASRTTAELLQSRIINTW